MTQEIPEKLAPYVGKWTETDTSSKETFLNDWAFDQTCGYVRWVKKQGEVPTATIFERFVEKAKTEPSLARTAHYQGGCLVSENIRQKWVDLVATESVQAAIMWLEDETTTEEQDRQLETSFRDPTTGAPEYCRLIDSGEKVRKKTYQKVYHEDSLIIQQIING